MTGHGSTRDNITRSDRTWQYMTRHACQIDPPDCGDPVISPTCPEAGYVDLVGVRREGLYASASNKTHTRCRLCTSVRNRCTQPCQLMYICLRQMYTSAWHFLCDITAYCVHLSLTHLLYVLYVCIVFSYVTSQQIVYICPYPICCMCCIVCVYCNFLCDITADCVHLSLTHLLHVLYVTAMPWCHVGNALGLCTSNTNKNT